MFRSLQSLFCAFLYRSLSRTSPHMIERAMIVLNGTGWCPYISGKRCFQHSGGLQLASRAPRPRKPIFSPNACTHCIAPSHRRPRPHVTFLVCDTQASTAENGACADASVRRDVKRTHNNIVECRLKEAVSHVGFAHPLPRRARFPGVSSPLSLA